MAKASPGYCAHCKVSVRGYESKRDRRKQFRDLRTIL